jgi:hypothetical protein
MADEPQGGAGQGGAPPNEGGGDPAVQTQPDPQAGAGNAANAAATASESAQDAAQEQEVPADQVPTPEGMTRVHIVSRFMLNREDHTQELFDPKGTNCGLPGYYDVSEKDASHFYLLAHTDNPPPPIPPAPGTIKDQEEKRHEATRRQRIQAALDQEEIQAADDLKRNRQKRTRVALEESDSNFTNT